MDLYNVEAVKVLPQICNSEHQILDVEQLACDGCLGSVRVQSGYQQKQQCLMDLSSCVDQFPSLLHFLFSSHMIEISRNKILSQPPPRSRTIAF